MSVIGVIYLLLAFAFVCVVVAVIGVAKTDRPVAPMWTLYTALGGMVFVFAAVGVGAILG